MGIETANPRIAEALAQLEREIASGRPPADDYDIAIRRDGSWHYRGSPIARAGIVKLFASVLHRTADGRYWLVTPVERTIVHVEDVPFVGVELASEGSGRTRRLCVRTNLDAWYPLDAAHPLRMAAQPHGGAVPYMRTRDELEARLARPLFYELAEMAEPGPSPSPSPREGQGQSQGDELGVWSHGAFFALHAPECAGADRPGEVTP